MSNIVWYWSNAGGDVRLDLDVDCVWRNIVHYEDPPPPFVEVAVAFYRTVDARWIEHRWYPDWSDPRSRFDPTNPGGEYFQVSTARVEQVLGWFPGDSVPNYPGPGERIPGSVEPARGEAVDFAALAAELRKANKPTPASLIEFMADKEEATVEDVAQAVHGDDKTSGQTVWANMKRTNDYLDKQRSPLSFRMAASRIFREISPTSTRS